MTPGMWPSRRIFGSRPSGSAATNVSHYWSLTEEDLLRQLGSSRSGLTSAQANSRASSNGAEQRTRTSRQGHREGTPQGHAPRANR